MEPTDPVALRHAFGCFATGVTVVTARASDGELVGLTANSFTSVSLTPPLILVSLAYKLRSFASLRHAGHFAVNVLGAAHAHVAAKFATAASDKWGGIDFEPGHRGAPILRDAVAVFECETFEIVPAGDHALHLGRVVRATAAHQHAPLIFYRGQFTTTHDDPEPPAAFISPPLNANGM